MKNYLPKIFTILIIAVIYFSFTPIIYAIPVTVTQNTPTPTQTPNNSSSGNANSNSSTFTTCIKGKPCHQSGDNTSGNPLLKTALDLAGIYQQCNHGSTIPSFQLSDCGIGKLRSLGYKEDAIQNTFSTSSLIRFSYPETRLDNVSCVQCIGFVQQVIILTYDNEDPQLSSVRGPNDLYSAPFLDNNGHKYINVGNVKPEPGDIGIGDAGDYGHILIVKQATSGVTFDAVESNWTACQITTQMNPPHTITDGGENYHFFRLSP